MNKFEDQRWGSTRAGARAGRGFRYQDAVAATLLIEQWSLGTAAKIVPEGLDDLSLFVGVVETRIQAKSMHDPKGTFRSAQLAGYLDKSASLLTAPEWLDRNIRLAVILERPVADFRAKGWAAPLALCEDVGLLRQALLAMHLPTKCYSVDQLLERSFLLVENSPLDRAVDLLAEKRDVPAFVCRLAAQHLRIRAGLSADENYLRLASNPSVVTTADVMAAMENMLLATQEGGLERAVQAGLCEIVDFSSEVQDKAFYSGVNVVPGHVAAGLVFDRPLIVAEIERAIDRGGSVLVAGQSGSGKSASAWLYAYATRHEVIWYQVNRLLEGDAHLVLRLAVANEAGRDRRVGFVLDDVGRNFVGSWGELVRGAAQTDGVILVGTIREEDLDLIADLRASIIVRPRLDEELASRLFSQLSPAQLLRFHHWREPFEQSKGLLLEYTHLLTQGEHLEAVLRDQVRQRVFERRDDELLILQAVSFGSRFAASLDKERLRAATALAPLSFARALNRLLEEHAISLIGDDCIGGLHEIRSRHLDALVREIAHVGESSSLALAIASIRFEDLARFVSLLHREMPALHQDVVGALYDLLQKSPLRAWIAAYHGLGLITCDLVGKKWMEICTEEGIEERFAHTVFSLAIADAKLESLDCWEKICGAMDRFAKIGVRDMRGHLATLLSDVAPPLAWSLQEATEFAAALMPLHGAVDSPVVPDWLVSTVAEDPSAVKILGFCSVLREAGEQIAAKALEVRRGSAVLLKRLHEQTAWLTMPVLEEDGEVQVVSANFRVVNDEVQTQLHDRAVSMCELLIAAAPQADVAACSAVLGDGTVMKVGEYPVADVRLERKRVIVAARVAWNRAQLRSIQLVQEVDSDTARANNLASAIREVTSNLRQVAEYFCRLDPVPAKLRAFASIRKVLTGMIRPGRVDSSVSGVLDKGRYDTSDSVADLVEEIQEITRVLSSGTVDKPLLRAANSMKLSRKMREAARSRLWRYTELARDFEFDKAARFLEEIAYVLADLHTCPSLSYSSRAALSKRSRNHSSLEMASTQSLDRAAALVETRRLELQAQFVAVRAGCVVVSRRESFEMTWPAASFAILIPCNELVEFYQVIGAFVAQNTWEGLDTRIAAPLLCGKVAARFALGGVSTLFPQLQFADEWRDVVRYPFLDDVATSAFDRILGDCTCISAAMTGLDRDLNEEEAEFLGKLIEPLSDRLRCFFELKRNDDDEVIQAAGLFLAECTQMAKDQIRLGGAGPSLAREQAQLFRNEVTESNSRVIGFRLLLASWDAAAQP